MKTAVTMALVVLSAAALLTGCTNPYKDSFESRLERVPAGEPARVLPPTGEVRIVTSTRMREDAMRMMEEGWLLLGRSRFRETLVDPDGAIAVARDIGASVVMIRKEYAETVEGTEPVAEWIPPRTVTRREQQVITSGPDSGLVVEREVTTKHDAYYRTAYVPTTTDYYDYAVTYWAKSKPPIFGVIVRALSDSEKVEIQSNRGVNVRVVINESPAFDADILRGDIITSFAGMPVSGVDQFFRAVAGNAGREVVVELIRDGEPKSISVRLRSD